MKNTFENNSSMAARQSMRESAADSQQFASAECAASDTIMYQVNIHTDVDDEETFDIVEYAEGNSHDITVGTRYLDGGYDSTEWCAFVGTLEECQSFVAERDKWCAVPTTYMYGRKGCDVLKVTYQRVQDAIFVGSMKKCEAEAERYIAENMRPVDYIYDVKYGAFQSGEEAMEAIKEMVKRLNSRGDEILVKSFVDRDIETGLRGLGVEVTEVWKASDECEEDHQYSNWWSIGIEDSNWNTKDITIIRGIQAAAYLTWMSIKDKMLRIKTTLTLSKDNSMWDTYKEYSLVDRLYNTRSDNKFEECEYHNYLTYSETEELSYKDIIYIVDVLNSHRISDPIVLK